MDDNLKAELHKEVKKSIARIISLRHELHQIPEQAFKEEETAQLIRKRLNDLGINILPSITGTDVCAVIAGKEGGTTTALRADIDALPIMEKTGVPWTSKHPDFSHSCGHDGHIAMLLGAAEILQHFRKRFSGNALLIFQPGEENVAGALRLIGGGILSRAPIPQSIFGIHGWPVMKAGQLGSRAGALMAGAGQFTLSIHGKGGHVANPQACIDPILTAARIVESIQSIVSRSIDPLEPAVVSICSIHAGSTGNIIPDEAVLKGTFRYFWPELGAFIQRKIIDISDSICKSTGAESLFQLESDYTPLINDEKAVHRAGKAISDVLGEEHWTTDITPTMIAEDFAFYLEKISGAFLRLGLGEDHPKLHTADFDFNDEVLEPGILALCSLVMEQNIEG